MPFEKRTLGRTGLRVGPLGLASSYGLRETGVERAFERGCNYLYWGSVRRRPFGRALARLCATRRDDVVLVLQSYGRFRWLVRRALESGLRRLGTDHADVLLLGMWNRPVKSAILETAVRLREEGKARFLAVSTHQRLQAARWLQGEQPEIDVIHLRYNAAHRGAEAEVFPHVKEDGPGLVVFTATRWGSLCKPRPGIERTPDGGDCYRFVLSRAEVDVCLSAPKDDVELDLGLAALDGGPMSEDELAWMRDVGDRLYEARRGRGETGFLSR
jgi:aryl-alcohol dehydrogenase-like predicted oxidoreductase